MLDFTPDPIAFTIGPLPVYWYGIGYALGLAAAYLVMVRLARRAGEDDEILGNGIIVVAVAALIGGRLYHVIDQWVLYKDDPIKIFLPPYSGLGVYGGILTGTIAAFLYARYKKVPFLRWADIVAPGLFTMQAIARWGNFFNQELYGTPTTLPWGIPIDCAHRISGATFDYSCAVLPETTRFHPLFLYESLSGLLGAGRPGVARVPRSGSGCGRATCCSSSSSGTRSSGSSSRRSARATGRSSASRSRRSCRAVDRRRPG